MKVLKFTVPLALLITVTACIDETIQLNKFSDDFILQRQIAIPLVKASFAFEEIAGRDYDSLAFFGNGDTIWIYLRNDLELDDTLEINIQQQEIDIEYLNLYTRTTNMFPAGLDIRFYLYDSILGYNTDTIFFNDIPGETFIQPAPYDDNGITIEDEVITDSSIVALDHDLLEKLFSENTKLIIAAGVPATDGIVKVLKHYRLSLQFGIDVKVRYKPGND